MSYICFSHKHQCASITQQIFGTVARVHPSAKQVLSLHLYFEVGNVPSRLCDSRFETSPQIPHLEGPELAKTEVTDTARIRTHGTRRPQVSIPPCCRWLQQPFTS